MNEVILLSNGDFRDQVGVSCWAKQEETLKAVEKAFSVLGIRTRRGNPYKTDKKHGFITTQSEACAIFSSLNPSTPIVLVLASWVWAHHLASVLKLHKGPVLLLGNFDGTWPGLVSLLNHSATLERMSIRHSKIWTETFLDDNYFMRNLITWISSGRITYPEDHITDLESLKVSETAIDFGKKIADRIKKEKRILGQMDPGCMGMLNAVFSPDKLAEIAMPLELLSQSDLLAEMNLVPRTDAIKTFQWLKNKNVTFRFGKKEASDLTESQVLEQMKMYIAAGRIYRRYGLSAIGIPYQYGLVRCTAASDLPEGMLNNTDRPDIEYPETGEIINRGKPIIHFNEGDIGSAVPQVLMHDILIEKGLSPETTLHDIRWGKEWDNKFIWALEISGGAPPAHYGGWDHAVAHRQTPMYFPKGGGTCTGVSKPGPITWARFYECFGRTGMDLGTGEVLSLPDDELAERRESTSKEWPIANVHIPGYGRDELMSSHKSNHITLCYGNILRELAAACNSLGIRVNIIGDARKDLGG